MTDTGKAAKEVFQSAVEKPSPSARAAYLDEACGENAALRREVEELLNAHDKSNNPLERPAVASTVLTSTIVERPGMMVGPYKLMEQIGEGGFGLVFVAEQQQPMRRKVALKVIKPGMDTRDVIARFEAERQALALMDHPNIARVLDAGATDSGRPYFVMELVRGIPITMYCDQNNLTPRERLELFVPVCNAIQHAHLKGIVHRDIKPSNVLVTLHDGKPVVKVIDFGVAKALHQPLTDKTIYTRFAQMIGTPSYMSPEQAEMSGLDIDTRTDVYSLGVLMYELLTSLTPFDKQRLAKAAYEELLKIIREEEPPRPSTRLSRSGDSLPSIAAHRKTEPGKLSKMFLGDLDWIAMKALEKDRTRRYETANAFAADVLRYLLDEPVEACPPSRLYLMRKLAKKHRGPVIVGASVMVTLLLGIAGTTLGLVRAKSAEQAAGISERKAVDALMTVTEERDAKEKERDRAERYLANGLLRPIGFSDNSMDTAELSSFVEWSSIEESPLKLRVLESAFDDPATALRVARRAERVIQACVGLSPTRRAHAIEFVSRKQRDMAADPRIRIAACWLALELGSANLPAWSESVQYLSNEQNEGSKHLHEFVVFALSGTDPQQVSHLSPEPLIAMLEQASGPSILDRLGNGLENLVPQLEPAQVTRAMDAIIARVEKTPYLRKSGITVDIAATMQGTIVALAERLEPAQVPHYMDHFIALVEKSINASLTNDSIRNLAIAALTALGPRMDAAQVKRTGDRFISILERSQDRPSVHAACMILIACRSRLEPEQVIRCGNAFIAILEKPEDLQGWVPSSKGGDGKFWASSPGAEARGLAVVAPELKPEQVTRAWNALIRFLEKPENSGRQYPTVDGLTALAPRLKPAEVSTAWNSLITILEKPNYKDRNDDGTEAAKAVLSVLALRMEPEQIKQAADALIRKATEVADRGSYYAAAKGLGALGGKLAPAQATRAGETLIKIIEMTDVTTQEETKAYDLFVSTLRGLRILGPRLEPAQVARAGKVLITIIENAKDSFTCGVAYEGLEALAAYLEPAQLAQARDALISIIENSKDNHVLDIAGEGFVRLGPHLEPAEIPPVWRTFTAILEKTDESSALETAGSVLSVLAPRMEQAQVGHAAESLLAIVDKTTDPDVIQAAGEGLAALGTRLEPAQRLRSAEVIAQSFPKMEDTKAYGWGGEFPHSYLTWGPAIFSLLEPETRETVSVHGTTILLDCTCLLPDHAMQVGFLAPFLSSPQSLAKLLSHPGCVGEQRDSFLMRFEELVLHEGRPVFLKPKTENDKSNREKPLAENKSPLRQFHSLHDAAAWIQKNWPDFDLETNHSVTWRGSR